MRGVSIREIQQFLGHSRVETTIDLHPRHSQSDVFGGKPPGFVIDFHAGIFHEPWINTVIAVGTSTDGENL
jgi:hypothetical protein